MTFNLDNGLLKHTNSAEHHALLSSQDTSASVQLDQNPYKLKVGSTVQYGKPVEYGVIKWMGMLPGREDAHYAGVEMVR